MKDPTRENTTEKWREKQDTQTKNEHTKMEGSVKSYPFRNLDVTTVGKQRIAAVFYLCLRPFMTVSCKNATETKLEVKDKNCFTVNIDILHLRKKHKCITLSILSKLRTIL